MEKYFAVSYFETGLKHGLPTRQVFRAFTGENLNQVDSYLMRENLQGTSQGTFQVREIYPRRTLTRMQGEHILSGEIKISEVPEEIAIEEMKKLNWRRINVSPGLDEFLDPELMR